MAAGTEIANTFRHYMVRISPRALKGYFGDRLFGVISLLFDELVDGVRQGVRLRFPNGNESPTDVLPYLARNFSIPWIPGESETSYRNGLAAFGTETDSAPGKVLIDGKQPSDSDAYNDSEYRATGVWRRHVRRGSPESVIEELARCGIAGTVEESADYDSGNPYEFDRGFDRGFTVLTTNRYRYRIRVYGYSECSGFIYGVAPPYASGNWHYGAQGDIPYDVVESIKAVCRHYGPARSLLETVRCVVGGFLNGFSIGFDSVFITPMGFNCGFQETAFTQIANP